MTTHHFDIKIQKMFWGGAHPQWGGDTHPTPHPRRRDDARPVPLPPIEMATPLLIRFTQISRQSSRIMI